jgi:hypothetical protein
VKEPLSHWKELNSIQFLGVKAARVWEHRLVELRVLRSISTTKIGDKWIHLSVSRPDRLPSWEELSKVKDEFLGAEAEAYQVLAKRSDHVNTHPYCLHLWSPVDGQRKVANLKDLTLEEAI